VKSGIGWTGLLAVALAGLVAAYGAYLLLLGPILTVTAPGGAASTVREPNPAGIVLILGAALVWYGVQRRKERWAWIGATAALAFSVLFVFGPGGILIPLSVALMGLLAARRMRGTDVGTARPSQP
jgi:hypothetical protein